MPRIRAALGHQVDLRRGRPALVGVGVHRNYAKLFDGLRIQPQHRFANIARLRIVDVPAVVVSIVRTAFVSRLVSVTVAPDTSASDRSFTVPRMVDAPVCPQLGAARSSAQTNTAKLPMINDRFINCSFRAPYFGYEKIHAGTADGYGQPQHIAETRS